MCKPRCLALNIQTENTLKYLDPINYKILNVLDWNINLTATCVPK